ncbi:PspC domain-containing protein [Streptomyces finlayi]|uniref:PspC domain-containing protein n=1 Tax=Streptomyces finlayi TaxID=67296 RepID=A0A7G7BJJ2_9ACTN|nr:PspC domain-containing protein [Streptomyces finlayi]QNE75507.1 PspC domain-containing protein [Streptomyces finlayi]
MTATQDTSPGVTPPPEPKPQLHRSSRQKVVAGVCGGLGRYCDVDPVIFRIVLGVLSLTGGIGLIFYGFAWLLLPLDGEEENEARKLLSGRVDGASLIALVLALVGCGLFLSMLHNGGMLAFAAMLSLAVIGSTVWAQHRRNAPPDAPLDTPSAQAAGGPPVHGAPPEVKAPPTPGSPSWWRDPIVKDGTSGPVGPGYLWGPQDSRTSSREAGARTATADDPYSAPYRPPGPRGPRSIGGPVFFLALVAGGVGTVLTWDDHPLGTTLQFGLCAALGVFALGLVAGSFLGRTGFGTIFLTVVTAGLLAGASAVPKDIGTDWIREEWNPVSVAAVQPRYELGTGVARLDLSEVVVPRGDTLVTALEVGAGRAVVVVPEGVTVKVDARAGLGDIQLPAQRPGDVDVAPDQTRKQTLAPPSGAAPAGTVVLSLEVGVGQVEVIRAAS